jgi:hypothetical protein
MLNFLRCIFDTPVKSAARRAREFIATSEPHLILGHVSLRADEPDEYVFAVFYEIPKQAVRPMRYMLVKVAKPSNEVSKLEGPESEPYRIRNYR